LRGQLRAHVAILTALVTISAYNSLAFVATTFRPALDFLPVWLQISIRGSVVPVLFLLTGALSPLHADAGDLLAGAATDMLHGTVRAVVKQWRARIRAAKRAGTDLAPVAVALMRDAGDHAGARRIALIAEGLAAAETGPSPRAHAGRAPRAAARLRR
jgi:hypothetical protein